MTNFDKIFVISLTKKRPNKFNEFLNRLPDGLGINDITLQDAVDGSDIELPVWWNQQLKGAYGCLMSHVNILKEIEQNNYINTIILEDDAVFCDNFMNKLYDIYKILPQDWDQLYLGGQHLQKPININHMLVKGININRTHAYIIKNKYIASKCIKYLTDKDFWIKNLIKNRYHIDYAYGVLHKTNILNAYASKPFIVGQAPNSYSDTGSQKSSSIRWWNQ